MIDKSAIVRNDLVALSDYSLQLNRWFLKPIGAWPTMSRVSRVERTFTLIVIVICYGSILLTVVPCVLHIILEAETLHLRLKMIGPLSYWFVGGINYTALLWRHKEIKGCVRRMETDWRAATTLNVYRIMLKDAKFGRYVAALCGTCMQIGVLWYCVGIAFTTQIVQIGNETKMIRLLPCMAYKKLIAVDSSPTFEIILAVQLLSGFVVNSVTVGAFSLAAVFAAHAHGQLDVLMMQITEFVDESRKRDKSVRLHGIGVFVRNHLRVLRFISCIEGVMNQICFMELFKCTLDICMLGYYILTCWAERDIPNMTSYIIIFCSMCFNLFIICYIGDKLSEQSRKVGDAIFMSRWYGLPSSDVLDLTLIISRSSVVTQITAGKLVHMSLDTFTSVMKTAFAYLNVLRQTT